MDYAILSAIGSITVSVLLAGFFIHRRRPVIGYFLGLLPILAYGVWFIYPLITCKSDHPLGCEWAGVGVLFFGGITLAMIVFYSFIAGGIIRAHGSQDNRPAGRLPGWRSFFLSLQTILLLLALSAAGGAVAKWIFDLSRTGMFVPWVNLGAPSNLDIKAGEKLVRIDSYDLRSIQIETNQGRLFETGPSVCGVTNRWNNTSCWFPGHQQERLATKASPNCRYSFKVSNPPGPVISRVETSSCFPAYRMQTEYVLRADGSVWVWHHEVNREDIITLTPVLTPGILAGLCLGLFLTGRLSRKRRSTGANDPLEIPPPGTHST